MIVNIAKTDVETKEVYCLTPDHKVFINGQWIMVQDLPGYIEVDEVVYNG